jgi:hypothetical protein
MDPASTIAGTDNQPTKANHTNEEESMTEFTRRLIDEIEADTDMRTTAERRAERARIERNRIRRKTNQMLRDITGTNAREAREDMGLSRY